MSSIIQRSITTYCDIFFLPFAVLALWNNYSAAGDVPGEGHLVRSNVVFLRNAHDQRIVTNDGIA